MNRGISNRVWWLIKEIHARGLLYRGSQDPVVQSGQRHRACHHTRSAWATRRSATRASMCGFAPPTIRPLAFLAWTTTPWTLISNVALAVGPDIDYVEIALTVGDGEPERLILAAERLEVIKEDFKVVKRWRGRDLVGRTYEPAFRVAGADYSGGPVAGRLRGLRFHRRGYRYRPSSAGLWRRRLRSRAARGLAVHQPDGSRRRLCRRRAAGCGPLVQGCRQTDQPRSARPGAVVPPGDLSPQLPRMTGARERR